MRPGERLGLVGRNGCGKSTLLRILLEEESPDKGNILTPRGYRIGHLAQHLEFHAENILQEVCLGLREDERDQEYRGEIMLAGLGFAESDFSKPASAFSGGFQIRLNLARLLLSEPNLLLLDEPTNYLDIVSMRWLSEFLTTWSNEMIIISHDRLFMDSVTTDTMLIHRGGIRKMSGGTDKLYQKVSQDEEIYEKTRLNEQKKRRELEKFIGRFRAQASKAALVQSRVKALERMGELDELTDEETLDFWFCGAPFEGKQMMEVKNLSFAYPNGPTLIDDLSLAINRRDRIGIIGKNGKGKSTLLRLLYKELTPSKGELFVHANARVGYFGQTNIARLAPALTVEQEIANSNPALHRTKVRAICGTMMFEGDDGEKKIGVLSGGEKSRVLLGKILAQPSNLLLLDEPTNHLDMESIEALLESLRDYEGAVILVTHSELLLRELATRLVVFQGSRPHILDHGYDYFLEKEGWGEEEGMSSATPTTFVEERKTAAPVVNQNQPRSKDAKKLQKKIDVVEQRIQEREAEQRTLESSLSTLSGAQSREELQRVTIRLAEIQREIEGDFEEFESLSNELKGVEAD
jgi:ATP-binding cassette subfamily F protein 3